MEKKTKNKSILKKASILFVVTLTLVSVVALSGCTQLNNLLGNSGTSGQVVTTTNSPTFTITPTVSAGNGVLSDDKSQITIPFYANTTSHTIKTGTNTTWVNPVISFVIKPVAFSGATTIDLGIIHYEIVNPNQMTDDTHYIITKTSGNRQAIWTGDGTQYVHGDSQISLTGNKTLVLTLTCDQTGLSYTPTVYSQQILTVRFYNDATWSYPITISFYATKIGAKTT